MEQISCRKSSEVSDSKTASRSSKRRQTAPPDRPSPKIRHSSLSPALDRPWLMYSMYFDVLSKRWPHSIRQAAHSLWQLPDRLGGDAVVCELRGIERAGGAERFATVVLGR